MSIKSVLFDKPIMCAFFLYPSVVQDNNLVGILDSFKPVGNGDNGTSLD